MSIYPDIVLSGVIADRCTVICASTVSQVTLSARSINSSAIHST